MEKERDALKSLLDEAEIREEPRKKPGEKHDQTDEVLNQ
jgi:hypothetical protein